MTRLFKFTIYILVIALLVFTIPQEASAASCLLQESDVIYLEDGYIVVTTKEVELRASNTKSGTRYYTYNDNNGNVVWEIALTGVFTYTGTSATCTSSSVNVTINNNNWYTVSKTAGKSGNTATADVTMGKKLLGITISKTDYRLTLTCSPTGTLS